MSRAYRNRGRLHIECDACSSLGATHAETARTPEGAETLPNCPWCGAPLGVTVETIDPPVTPPPMPPLRSAAETVNLLLGRK
jgi:hypothetical protein